MTIDELLIQNGFTLDKVEQIKRNDSEGQALVIFKQNLPWDGVDAHVKQMLIVYSPETKHIKAMRLYGSNLQSVCDYVDMHGNIFWHSIIHYLTEFDSFPQTLLLLTPASML